MVAPPGSVSVTVMLWNDGCPAVRETPIVSGVATPACTLLAMKSCSVGGERVPLNEAGESTAAPPESVLIVTFAGPIVKDPTVLAYTMTVKVHVPPAGIDAPDTDAEFAPSTGAKPPEAQSPWVAAEATLRSAGVVTATERPVIPVKAFGLLTTTL